MLNYYDSFLNFEPNEREIAIIKRMGWKGFGFALTDLDYSHIFFSLKEEKIRVLHFLKYDEKTISKLPLNVKTKLVIYAKISSEKELMNMVKKKEIRALIIDASSLKKTLSREAVNILKQHEDKLIIVTFSSLLDPSRNPLTQIAVIREKERLLYKLRKQLIFASGAASILQMSSPRVFKDTLFEIGIREEVIILGLSKNPESLFRMPNPIILEGIK